MNCNVSPGMRGIVGQEIRNVVALAVLAFLEALQFLICIALILSFFPPAASPLANDLLIMIVKDLKPEREMGLYRLFVLAAVGIFFALMFKLRAQLTSEKMPARLLPWLMFSGVFLALEIYCIVMLWAYDLPWAKPVLCASAVLAIILRCLWPWVYGPARQIWDKVRARMEFSVAGTVIVLAGIALLIYPPDIDKIVANDFLQDNFYHFDSFFMSPGWAHLSHKALNVDVISLYSVTAPVWMAHIATAMGGFNYAHVMVASIGISIIYFWMCYGFLRVWFNSMALAVFGITLAIKLNVFHFGVSPIIWRFPSATPCRYFFDIIFFSLVLMHVRRGKALYLALAAVVVGIALPYMLDTGMYMAGTFYVYLLLVIGLPVFQQRTAIVRGLARMAGWGLVPLVTAALMWALIGGTSIFNPAFWTGSTEFFKYFLLGLGSLPLYEYMPNKEIWPLCMGLFIPAVYVLTILITGALYVRGRIHKDNILAILISIYGLGLYHYFINRSAMTSYYVVAVPYVLVLCYWAKKLISRMGPLQGKAFKGVLIIVTVFMLFLNDLFIRYPNALNLTGKDWAEEKAQYKQGSDLSSDVDLIRRNTSPQEDVPVVGSFATKLLMEAGRRPFFYYFPLIASRPMEAITFAGGTYILTKSGVNRTMEELKQKKPRIVFIEKKLLLGQLPMPYYQSYELLTAVVMYIRENYVLLDQGKYLQALIRK